jgi:hypothetical protein
MHFLKGGRRQRSALAPSLPRDGAFSAKLTRTMTINEGDRAPDFDLETDEGTRVSLESLRGRNVVLFFYPKDNTSG